MTPTPSTGGDARERGGTFSRATFARHVAAMERLTQARLHSIVDGMWNPRFCDDDATLEARLFCVQMRERLDFLLSALPADSLGQEETGK